MSKTGTDTNVPSILKRAATFRDYWNGVNEAVGNGFQTSYADSTFTRGAKNVGNFLHNFNPFKYTAQANTAFSKGNYREGIGHVGSSLMATTGLGVGGGVARSGWRGMIPSKTTAGTFGTGLGMSAVGYAGMNAPQAGPNVNFPGHQPVSHNVMKMGSNLGPLTRAALLASVMASAYGGYKYVTRPPKKPRRAPRAPRQGKGPGDGTRNTIGLGRGVAGVRNPNPTPRNEEVHPQAHDRVYLDISLPASALDPAMLDRLSQMGYATSMKSAGRVLWRK